MQDNDERLGTRYPIKPAVMGFPADKVTCRMQTFECSLLRPLEYICLFNFVARNFPQGAISSQSRYDRFDTSAYSGASARKASISIPETSRGVNVSAGQIRQNDEANSKKTAAQPAPRMCQLADGRVTACRPAAGRAPPKGCCSGGCTAAQFPGWAAPYRESSRSPPRRRDRRGCR